MKTTRDLKSHYDQGDNISELLRQEYGLNHNTDDIIEISYDLQSGSYIDSLKDPRVREFVSDYTDEVAKTILSLCSPSTVLEAGVGDATTMSHLCPKLGDDSLQALGFDISWSRVACGQRWLLDSHVNNASLFVGNLFAIPVATSAIDVVYTSHSIEPNGGHEEEIIKELYRITGRYLVLLEPGYEQASEEARTRMERHGYCRNIAETCERLGYRVLKHELFPLCQNPLNPTVVTIIEKDAGDRPEKGSLLVCPRTKTPLERIGDVYYSAESMLAYPIILGVPCLRRRNGILATKYPAVFREQAAGRGPLSPSFNATP